MALDIGRLISDIYSAHSSPSATWARRDLAVEKKKALDEENDRKRLLQRDIDEGATARTRLTNEGNLAVTKEQSAGALARQGLANEGAVNQARVAGQLALEGHRAGAEATKYVADQSLAGTKYKADIDANSAKYTGPDELLKAHSAIIKDPMVSPEDKQTSMEYIQHRTRQALGQPLSSAPDGVIGQKPAAAAPSVTPSVAPTLPARTTVSPVSQPAKIAPPPKTLDQQEAEFNANKRSATGFSFFNSPKQIEANKQYWKIENAKAQETEEQRKKRQEQNRLRAGL